MEAINLNRLAYFAAVVDMGSFTRAADRLGVNKTVVSQQVARLEAELKTSLLLRTTRRVEPTEAGRQLHARCVMILSEAEEAFAELAQTNAQPLGVLRITASNDYGAITVAPLAAEFCRIYPACRVDLILSDARMDLVANQIDLSIRVGWLTDSSLQARRISSFRQFLVAAPDIAGDLSPSEPEELSGLPFVANVALKEPLVWRFTRGDHELRTVRMKPGMTINSTPAVLEATLAGAGMSILPDFLVGDHVAAGRLVPILPAWTLPTGGIHAVYPAGRFRPPKVARFVEMLSQNGRQRPRNLFRNG
ncbi:LysR family transcriptional regulator [Mesorhizobium sp. M1182]|uniref:LysR family transcriptional regulator n=1 Tax=unclassified Mesorhizobium TaxID=325217 RepID=UPI0033388003